MKVGKLMNIPRIKIKPGTLTAAAKMEKLIVLVGLIVHFFFFKTNRRHVLVASVGCQLYRLLRSELGHSLFYFF